jgi:hypothetical protein
MPQNTDSELPTTPNSSFRFSLTQVGAVMKWSDFPDDGSVVFEKRARNAFTKTISI